VAGGATPAQAATITYLSQFGAQGTGPGQFESPAAVAVNTATGDVYVTDITNDVVEEFNASGSYLSEFGGPGTFPPGNGQFDQPIAIAVDPGSRTPDIGRWFMQGLGGI
jgi:DNA-binding beta-propeller fold protein YncE